MGPESKRFVVIASPRTGSNYLCGGLDAHPDVVCHAELFHPDQVYATWRIADDLGDTAARDADPRGFLDRVWTTAGGAAAVGFKIFDGHNDTALDALLDDRGVKKLVLKRRNRVKTFVSEIVAARTGVYQRLLKDKDEPLPPPTRVHVDVKELRRAVARRDKFHTRVEEFLHRTDQTCLEVHYEDLVTQPATRARILEFIEVVNDVTLFQPRDLKQNPDDLRLLIENYDELAAKLAGDDLARDLIG